MHQKRNFTLHYFFIIFLFLITATAPQAMNIFDNDNDGDNNNTEKKSAGITLNSSITSAMEQDDVYSLLSAHVESPLPSPRQQGGEHTNTLPSPRQGEEHTNILDRATQYVGERMRRPKNWLYVGAGGAAAVSLLPSGILMSGFGNLSYALCYSWFHHPANAVPDDHILRTVLMAIPPCVTQSIWAYHAVDWTATHLSGCCNILRFRCKPFQGWRDALLNIAYSRPIIHLNGLVYEAFYFNLVATQVSHHRGFGGGSAWAYSLAALSLPISFYLFDYLNRDYHQSPLYSLTKNQEEALEKIYIAQYIAERDGLTKDNCLEKLLAVLEDPGSYSEIPRSTAWRSVLDKIEAEDLASIKYWYRLKRNIALYGSSLVQLAGLPFKGWAAYSLANKFCWVTEVSPDLAEKIAISATAALAIPIVFGAIAEQLRLQKAYMHILNGFKPEVSGYWGQRIPLLMAMGLGFWYLNIPTAYSYQREVEYNYYGNCTNVSYANCTGDYFGDLGPGVRFFDAAIFTSGIVWAASVHWFYQPLERTARWTAQKVYNYAFPDSLDVPLCFDQQKKTLSFTERLRDIKSKVLSWTDTNVAEEDSLFIGKNRESLINY